MLRITIVVTQFVSGMRRYSWNILQWRKVKTKRTNFTQWRLLKDCLKLIFASNNKAIKTSNTLARLWKLIKWPTPKTRRDTVKTQQLQDWMMERKLFNPQITVLAIIGSQLMQNLKKALCTTPHPRPWILKILLLRGSNLETRFKMYFFLFSVFCMLT